ncbi:MAG: hypothetical protein K8T91_26705 [Planctomycetes bacterium]|nr:hypothetical protein [Planctomycetota bacterium]
MNKLQSETDEIRQQINQRLADIEKEKAKLQKTIAAFEANVNLSEPERLVRLEVFNKSLDLMTDKQLDLANLLRQLPKSPTVTHKANADSWAGYVEYLSNADVRRKEGEDIELMRLAGEAALKRLGQWHTYEGNKEIDRPILNCDTVGDDG